MELRLGANIRSLRKKGGFTQEQLAEALGVTTGAVYKWESGRAAPELELLVEIARFFETSVDALLGYSWETMSMGRAAEQLRQHVTDRTLTEGMRFAEQALLKYPNSFQVVLKSADVYFLTMEPKHAARALELYQKAIRLMDQNTDATVGLATIQNRIAACYCHMDRTEDAIELLKQNNMGGMNDFQIGLLLSQNAAQAEEALKYLSEALTGCYSQLYNICIGYANAYGALEKTDQITELMLWFLELGKGLREPGTVSWMDRGEVPLYTILAEMDFLRGNPAGARDWLIKARDTALRFDAAPEYRAAVGLKFYHGTQQAVSYDDMGKTAMAMIENYMADDAAVGANLRPIWAEIQEESKREAEKHEQA